MVVKTFQRKNTMTISFHILDVFAEEKYEGNQLAVILDYGRLSDSQMQKLAKEMNYSETTFITSNKPHNGGYDVRIFTPKEEIPFAGHPTLGTAYIIREEIIREPVEKVVLNLKVGQIPVTFDAAGDSPVLWMRQKPPEFGKIHKLEQLARVLGIPKTDFDEGFSIQDVSTGFPFIIAPVKSLAALRAIKVDREKYFKLVEATDTKAILAFCKETSDPANDLCCRVFADYYGVPEDPATGSANGSLSGYLVKHRYLGSDSIDIRVEQGAEIGRPSILLHRTRQTDTEIEVNIGGKVVPVARGELL